jgi:hypothetical protein
VPKRLNAYLDKAIIALTLANLLLVALFFAAKREANLYGAGFILDQPSGFVRPGKYWKSGAGRCLVIRVSSDGCPSCLADQVLYSKLVTSAAAQGCEVATILTSEGSTLGEKGESRVEEVEYVDFRLGKILNPFITPQTMLLNSAGRLAWFREGTIDQESLNKAMGEMRSFK